MSLHPRENVAITATWRASLPPPSSTPSINSQSPTMSMFRAKKLDLGCFIKARTIRDHTKRKVFEAYETERYAILF